MNNSKIAYSLLFALLINLPTSVQAGWFSDLFSSSRAKIVACTLAGICIVRLLIQRYKARIGHDKAEKKEIEHKKVKMKFLETDSHMPNVFITKRIRAEKVTSAHAHYLTQILSDLQVQEAYNTTDQTSFTNVPAQLAIIHNQWQQYGYGLYIIFDLESSKFIGFAGYHTVAIDELGTVECFNASKPTHELELYAFLMPNYWHKGYGFEVASKLIDSAFKYLPFTSIIAYIEPKNQASLQFIKKLNFNKENTVMYNDKPHILFRLHKQ
jgi:RimJ/RimL family protein N-acetyltransferase